MFCHKHTGAIIGIGAILAHYKNDINNRDITVESTDWVYIRVCLHECTFKSVFVCVRALEQTAAEEWLRYQIRVSRQAKAHSGTHHLLPLIARQKKKKGKKSTHIILYFLMCFLFYQP